MADHNEYLEKIRELVEKPCLVYLISTLTRDGPSELAEDLGKLVSQEPTGYLSCTLSPPPGYEDHPGVRVGFSLAITPRGYYQVVPVGSQEESQAVFSKRVFLLNQARHWFAAFAAGSPELASACAEKLNTASLICNPTPDQLGLSLVEASTSMLAVVAFIIKPDGTFAYIPKANA